MSRYQLAGPPRKVSLLLRLQMLFGGFLNQFGWLFFGIGLIFMVVFGAFSDYASLYFAVSPTRLAEGQVTRVEATSTSVNEERVYANHFTFRVEQDETTYEGVSYTTGYRLSEGTEVEVQYVAANPAFARIVGTRSGHFGLWLLACMGIFPFVGFAFIVTGFIQGVKNISLLKRGHVVTGQLVSKTATNTTINEQPVYELSFDFTTRDGILFTAKARSHQPHYLEDDPEEQILYDPRNPERAVLVDNMPGQPDIDAWGKIHVAHPQRAVLLLIVPFGTLTVSSLLVLYFVLTRI